MSGRGKRTRSHSWKTAVEQAQGELTSQGSHDGASAPSEDDNEDEDEDRRSFIRELTPPQRIDVEALVLPQPADPGSPLLEKDSPSASGEAQVLAVETYRNLPTPATWPELLEDDAPKKGDSSLGDPSDDALPWSDLLPVPPSEELNRSHPQKK